MTAPEDVDQGEAHASDLATEDDVERLVRDFYRQAAVDEVLGPVFEAAEVDWAAHIPRVTAFWSWQLLGGRRYDGRPLRSHERVNEMMPFTEAHYERWLELFTDTLHEGWAGPVADTAERRARRMARSMRRVLAGEPDPDPTWPDEGDGPDQAGATSGPRGERSAGLVMRVALGPPRRRSDDDGWSRPATGRAAPGR